MSKRPGVEAIAGALIAKIDKMERTASRIEKASEKTIEIDPEGMIRIEEILKEMKLSHQSIKDDMANARLKNKLRLPNWVWMLLCFLTVFLAVGMYAIFDKAETYDLQLLKATQMEQRYLELKNQQK
jgi:hypothetical protein